jgi:hypothetical protein
MQRTLGDILCVIGMAAAIAVPSVRSETEGSRLRALGRAEAEQVSVATLLFAGG